MREIRATDGQRVLWFMDHYRGGDGTMSVPLLFQLRGPLDAGALRGALDDLGARHEALRSTFRRASGQLVMTCHEDRQIALTVTDVPGADGGSADADSAGEFVRQLLRADPDTAETVARASLLRLAPDDHLLVLDIHHLVTDAWSNRLITRDLAAFYNRRRGAAAPPLPPVDWQQSDYAGWQQEHLDGDVLRGHQEFWRDYLSGASYPHLPPLERAGTKRPLAKNEWFLLEPGLLDEIGAVARAERTTRFVVLLSVFLAAIQRVTGQPDLTVASILANRLRSEVMETVGFFANMVPVRGSAAPGDGPLAMIRNVRRSVLQVMEHQGLPYLTLPADPATAPKGRLEDVVFHMLAVPPGLDPGEPDFADLDTTMLPIPDGLGSRFDLELLVFPGQTAFSGVFRYAGDRFDRGYVLTLRDAYLAIAKEVAAGAGHVAAATR
jgi:hypothetical protein